MEPTHPDRLVENATAPLRLCARISGWEWRGQVGSLDFFTIDFTLTGSVSTPLLKRSRILVPVDSSPTHSWPPEEEERLLHLVFERVADYFHNRLNRESPVSPALAMEELEAVVDLDLTPNGSNVNEVLKGIDQFLQYSVRTSHPHFMQPLWGGISATGLAGDLLASAMTTSMYTYELAPIATLIEKRVIREMCHLAGFEDGEGIFTTGGSNGNTLGLLCARDRRFPESQRRGMIGRWPVAFVSEEAHYSAYMSANLLGLGSDNLKRIACDERGRMQPEQLKAAIRDAYAEGREPFCIIATAGTTVRGSFDDISEIAPIATQNGLWLHVDAAWGGGALLSPRHRHLLKGLELADSLSWDPHKMMGMPISCSTFMTRECGILASVCAHGDEAHYLFHEEARDRDLGRMSLQCGRRIDALKLWLAWRALGHEGWARRVDRFLELAEYLEQLVLEHPRLQLMSPRVFANVCLRYVPPGSVGEVDLNELNRTLRARLLQSGRFMISQSMIGDALVLRPVVANPGTDPETLQLLTQTIGRIGDELVGV
jgi:glutamate/tyrosine decarboxylase-like PLP-dependent enzyme